MHDSRGPAVIPNALSALAAMLDYRDDSYFGDGYAASRHRLFHGSLRLLLMLALILPPDYYAIFIYARHRTPPPLANISAATALMPRLRQLRR